MTGQVSFWLMRGPLDIGPKLNMSQTRFDARLAVKPPKSLIRLKYLVDT